MALESKTYRTDSSSTGKAATAVQSWNFDYLAVAVVLGVAVEVAGASYLVVAEAQLQARHRLRLCTCPCAVDSGAPDREENNPNISGIICHFVQDDSVNLPGPVRVPYDAEVLSFVRYSYGDPSVPVEGTHFQHRTIQVRLGHCLPRPAIYS